MSYSNGLLSDQSHKSANKYVQGLPGVGFKLTDTGDYDMQNKKLVNVDEGDNNHDVVNKHQLDVGLQTKSNKTDVLLLDGTTHMVGDLDLRGNKIILPGEIQMDRKLITNLDTDENQDLSAVNMITLKNKVQPKADKDYVDFEITKQNALINNTFVKKTGDQMTGDLILPHDSYPVQGNTNKAISYETQREIFLSRRESFPMQADINMNNNFIQNIATPTSSHQGVNKGYCDYNFLNRQKGGVIMGSLSMNRNDLTGIPDTPKFGYSAVNKNYVDGEIAKITTVDTNQFVLKSGSTMTGDLNMDNNNIIRLKDPVNDADAVTKTFFEKKLLESHLLPSHRENAFKYLLDQDESSSERNIIVNGIVDFNESPHKNKKAYDIDLIYMQGTQNYDSQIGINIYLLPVGKYTIIMEYYYPENIGIFVSCQASTAVIYKQISKNFTDYIKLLVQFNQKRKDTPDYLYFNIRGSGTTTTNPEGYLIFYGIKEWFDIVNSQIYDHALEASMFEYDNGNMKIQTILDLNNNKIINLSNATNANDAVNKGQLDTFKNKFDSYMFYMKNHMYINIFSHRFYDLKEPSKYTFTLPYISGIDPGLSFSHSRRNGVGITQFDPIKGLQFNSNMKIIMDIGYLANQNSPYTILISMTFKDTLKLSFVEPTQEQNSYLPVYMIDKHSSTFGMYTNKGYKSIRYEPSFRNKQIMIWIHHNPITQHYQINLVGDNSTDVYLPPISTFSTNKLKIEPGKNIINKICYQNQYLPNNVNNYTKLIFEEKKNGSYVHQ